MFNSSTTPDIPPKPVQPEVIPSIPEKPHEPIRPEIMPQKEPVIPQKPQELPPKKVGE